MLTACFNGMLVLPNLTCMKRKPRRKLYKTNKRKNDKAGHVELLQIRDQRKHTFNQPTLHSQSIDTAYLLYYKLKDKHIANKYVICEYILQGFLIPKLSKILPNNLLFYI